MKCYNHPTEEAVAVCKGCGKGLCQNCSVQVSQVSYCKTCIEGGRVQMQYTQYPQAPSQMPPQYSAPYGGYGSPNVPNFKALFEKGATGLVIAGIGAAIYAALSLYNIASSYGLDFTGSIMLIFFAIVFAYGISTAGQGYKGIKAAFGHSIGTAGSILAKISAVILILGLILAFVGGLWIGLSYYSSSGGYGMVLAAIYLEFAGFILFGATEIVWGVAHVVTRRFMGNVGLAMAAGVMFIVSGSVLIALIIFGFQSLGLFLFLASAILGAIAFAVAKPQPPAPQPIPQPY